jgi:exonuclease SbcC
MLSNISAKNFLSWKDLNFNVSKGATLVDGWNQDDQRSEGSGKSAVLNAVCWGIYGKLPKDANVDDVIKDGETSCSVVLEFDNGDSVVRTRKPNELFILKAGVTIKGKDARETQTLIEEYVGCNFETFCQSVYFAQNYDKKFLSSNQEDKGKILSSIQNLQVFDKARKEVMDLLKAETDKITKLKNRVQVEENNLSNFTSQRALIQSFIQDKIQKHEQQVAMINQQINLLNGHVISTEASIAVVRGQFETYNLDALSQDEVELNQAKAQYQTQLSGVTYQKGQIDSIKKAILGKETEGKQLAAKYQSIEQKLKSLNPTETHRYKALSANRAQILDLEKNTSRIRLLAKVKQLEDFISNPTKTCPSCGTELKTADTSHIQKELDQVKAEIEEISASTQRQAADYDVQINAELASSANQSTEWAQEAQQIVVQLQAVSEYLDQNKIPSVDDLTAQESEIKGVIKQIDGALFDTQQRKLQHAQLANQWDSLIRQLNSYNDQRSQFGYSLTQLGQPDVSQDQTKLKAVENELNKVQEQLTELRNLVDVSNQHSNRLETLKDGFKEIKSYVFTNALNELNFRTNQYLNDLFEMEATIKFTNEDQKIESKIVLDGKIRSLGLLSGGQNRRFNLAVDLALSDIVSYRKTSKLDLLIFDEYFKDLSEISMEKSLELLKSRKCPVILIEHNSIFKNIVDNTFFVRLENGTSFEARP